jgi:hypothetical protein
VRTYNWICRKVPIQVLWPLILVGIPFVVLAEAVADWWDNLGPVKMTPEEFAQASNGIWKPPGMIGG